MAVKDALSMNPGDVMPDGTIYAGISPLTKKRMYVTTVDAPLHMTFKAAADYARNLEANNHHDWQLPAQEELAVIYDNRNAGALKGTFNLAAPHDIWPSPPELTNYASAEPAFLTRTYRPQRRTEDCSVRCIRYA